MMLNGKVYMENVQTEKSKSPCGEKAALRREILKSRNALLPEQRRQWDQEIFRQLIQYDKASPCTVYLCYVSYKSEVSTKEFILWCLKNGKTVFVPKVMEKREPGVIRAGNVRIKDMAASVSEKAKITDMEFYQITVWEDLKSGYQGIWEPDALPEKSFSGWIAGSGIGGQFAEISPSVHADREKTAEKIRMLLPGAAFDRQGNRIGYGGGFYDRWLAWWNHTDFEKQGTLEKIGLAYGMQVVDSIPSEKFDQKVDFVITEENTVEGFIFTGKNMSICRKT